MATTLEPTPAPADRRKVVEYGAYIETELAKTRSRVKGVEIYGCVLTLAAGLLSYLLVLVAIDQWVFPGGLGTLGRFVALALLVAGTALYVGRSLLPLLLARINPVFAAHMIERSQPALKNSLVNFLLVRRNGDKTPQVVYQALEQRAATDLAHVPVESAVDRTRVIRIGYVLAAVVAACALYTILSPKPAFRSVSRIIAPWADLSVPTRVTIEDVKPGDASAFLDEYVTVTAAVHGLSGDEPVQIRYSTADGQVVGRTAE